MSNNNGTQFFGAWRLKTDQSNSRFINSDLTTPSNKLAVEKFDTLMKTTFSPRFEKMLASQQKAKINSIKR